MITLKDIAKSAGCDTSLVSRVLNGKPCRVSDQVRREIKETAYKLGYVPNRNASSLVSGRTHTIGLLVPNVYDGVFAEYIETLDLELSAAGYTLRPFICHNRQEKETAALNALLRHEVDAMIAMFHNDFCLPQYEQIRRQRKALIFRLPEPKELDHFDAVELDLGGEANGKLAEHLIECGCRKIGLVGGAVARHLAEGTRSDSVTAFAETLNRAGLKCSPENAIPCSDTQEAAYEALSARFRAMPKAFDALIVHNINKVFGSCQAVRDAGLTIPNDVKIATISDHPLCRMVPEPLTVWAQPVARICQSLVKAALNRLEHPDAPYLRLKFGSKLLIRKSTKGK